MSPLFRKYVTIWDNSLEFDKCCMMPWLTVLAVNCGKLSSNCMW